VDQATQLDLAASGPPDADAVLTASHQLAELAARSWIEPAPAGLTKQRAEAGSGRAGDKPSPGGWADVFPLLRAREAVWGDATMAVPFGSPVLTLYYRADLLEKLAARPPRTWAEYQKLAESLADRKRLGLSAPDSGRPWYGALEPLAPGWAGIMLLARAAPYASHRANYSTLFQIDTMEPLIQGPPFVRALEELIAIARLNPPEQFRCDPAAVRRAFWAGQCAMAVTWPTAADKSLPEPAPNFRLGVAELPGATEVYNISPQTWETRQSGEDSSVPLLDIAGRLGTVTARCLAPETAFRLLLWLSGDPWNRQVSAVSPDTTLFRQSDIRFAQAWTEKSMPAATAGEYAMLTRRTLSRSQWAFALRIPGRAEYLAALDEAVGQALRGQQPPQEALRQASFRWRAITNRLGLDRQRAAYHASLGLQ
jgi:multiple sugar transport system substrate-binding protein